MTRLLILKHHWIEDICEAVKRHTSTRRKFKFQFDSLEVYCNDEQTRTFLGLRVFDEDTSPMKELVGGYDQCLASYNLPKYYDPPSFHISILWCLGDQKQRLRSILKQKGLNEILQRYLDEDINDFTETVKTVCFKCGNRIYNYSLQE